jgi:hypothetical protein
MIGLLDGDLAGTELIILNVTDWEFLFSDLLFWQSKYEFLQRKRNA